MLNNQKFMSSIKNIAFCYNPVISLVNGNDTVAFYEENLNILFLLIDCAFPLNL